MKRTLHLESLTDGYVYPIVDSVNDKGEPTQQRLAAEKMLKKKLPVLDGRPGEVVPAYRIAKTPEVFSPHDPFDADLLKDDDGSWLFPSKKWKAEQAKRLGKRSDSAQRSEAQARAHATNQVVEGLARLAMSPPPANKPDRASQREPAKDTANKDAVKEGDKA